MSFHEWEEKSSFNCYCVKVANLQRIGRKQGVKLSPHSRLHSPSCAKRPERRRYPLTCPEVFAF